MYLQLKYRYTFYWWGIICCKECTWWLANFELFWISILFGNCVVWGYKLFFIPLYHAAFTEKHVDKRPKHADTLCKCSKENGKIPLIFPKKDGHPVGKYASEFMTELGKAVKKFAPLQVSGWKRVREEQKQPIFDRLEVSIIWWLFVCLLPMNQLIIKIIVLVFM